MPKPEPTEIVVYAFVDVTVKVIWITRTGQRVKETVVSAASGK